jgi:hypothetical protein
MSHFPLFFSALVWSTWSATCTAPTRWASWGLVIQGTWCFSPEECREPSTENNFFLWNYVWNYIGCILVVGWAVMAHVFVWNYWTPFDLKFSEVCHACLLRNGMLNYGNIGCRDNSQFNEMIDRPPSVNQCLLHLLVQSQEEHACCICWLEENPIVVHHNCIITWHR